MDGTRGPPSVAAGAILPGALCATQAQPAHTRRLALRRRLLDSELRPARSRKAARSHTRSLRQIHGRFLQTLESLAIGEHSRFVR